MAKSSFIYLSPSSEDAYNNNVSRADRLVFSSLRKNIPELNRWRKKTVLGFSKMKESAAAWQSLAPSVCDDWHDAGVVCGLTGWQLFLQEKSIRLSVGNMDDPTPSIYHQGNVGFFSLVGDAPVIFIEQAHPFGYFVKTKVTGKQKMFSPSFVTEKLTLPFTFGLSYKADLTATDIDAEAYLSVVIRRLYQGETIEEEFFVPLDLQTDWVSASSTVSALVGSFTSYTIKLKLYHLTGALFVDNIKAEHTGQNWVFDPFCDDINEQPSRAFYEVPRHWAVSEISDGCFFESVYPLD